MPRSDVPTFIDGDRCESPDGSIGHVRACNGTKGKYLKVAVSQGPQTGMWCWPEKFCRRPAIDWAKDGPATVCRDCERLFAGGADAQGLPRLWCVTCESLQGTTDRQRAAEPAGAEYRWKPKVYASERARLDAEESPF